MALNLAIPLVERLERRVMYELTEVGSDDTDEKGKTEKEKEREKESISYSCDQTLHLGAYSLERLKKSLFPENDLPVSELFASLPELPPEV